MPDQAVVHYEAFLEEMTYGHQWLLDTFNYTVKTSWSLDTFGLSSTFPYLMSQAGITEYYAQRSHYAIKKHLAKLHKLDYYWQPRWSTDDRSALGVMLTHLSPFLLYNIPYSCGPSYDVCCQFDFFKKKCWSWGKYSAPEPITQDNLDHKASLLTDQWRKKAGLSGHNLVLHLHGDDFRYSSSTEWKVQLSNLTRLMDYINKTPKFNMKARFSLVSDYFQRLRQLQNHQIPTLSGDMLVYADRSDQYWSGFYTSRPFLKKMIRFLSGRVRAADLLMTFASRAAKQSQWEEAQSALSSAYKSLLTCREVNSLMQHHDAITGTATAKVVKDYVNKIHGAWQSLDKVISTTLSAILLSLETGVQQKISQNGFPVITEQIEQKQVLSAPKPPSITTVSAGEKHYLTVFNSLPHAREEVVSVKINFRHVQVSTADGIPVLCQISPVLNKYSLEVHNSFKVHFLANLPALSISIFMIEHLSKSAEHSKHQCQPSKVHTYSNTLVHNHHSDQLFNHTFLPLQDVVFGGKALKVELCHCTGLLNAVFVNGQKHKLKQKFAFYTTGTWYDPYADKSGAYIFLPSGPARVFDNLPLATISVTSGPLVTTARTFISDKLKQSVTVYTVPGNQSVTQALFLETETDIRKLDNVEIALRFETGKFLPNEEALMYVDVNGFQTAQRRFNQQLPLQGNFHPMTSHVFLQGARSRFTLLSTRSHGVAVLKQGQVDVMLDRRLAQDDWRGLKQGIQDNVLIKSSFAVLLEELNSPVSKLSKPVEVLTVSSHLASLELYNPVIIQRLLTNVHKFPDTQRFVFYPIEERPLPNHILLLTQGWPCSLKLLNFKVIGESLYTKEYQLLTVHRTSLLCTKQETTSCLADTPDIDINVNHLMEYVNVTKVDSVLLSGTGRRPGSAKMLLGVMEVRSFCVTFEISPRLIK